MRSCSRSHWSEPGEQGTISAVMVVGALFLLAGFILHFPTESGTETEPPARQCAEISVIEGSARSLTLVYPNDTFWKLLSEGMFTPDENETCFWRERHALYGIGGPSARVHADVRGVEITPGKFLSDVLGYYFVLLVSDDEPAGVLSFVDQNSLGSAASHVGLGSVCILHAFRGRGCGTLLLSEALRLPKLRQMRATPLTATDRLAFYTTRRSATQPFLRPVVLDVVKANRTRWRELYSWYQRFGFESLENVSSTGFERLYMALKAEPTNYGYVEHSDHIHKPEASVL